MKPTTPVYTVKARIKTKWFGKPKLVYEIVCHFEEWYDSSHGNGGGEYVARQRAVVAFDDRASANFTCEELNTYNGV